MNNCDEKLKSEILEIRKDIDLILNIINLTFAVDNLTRDQVATLLRTTPANIDSIRRDGRKNSSGEKIYLKAQANGRFCRNDVLDYLKKKSQ